MAAVPAYAENTCGEAREFFRILFHDDRSSRYIVARKNGPLWSESSLTAGQLEKLDFSRYTDTYVTRNGFTGRRRRISDCRQVNAMMLDIDCHSQGFRSHVAAAVSLLAGLYGCGSLPEPTMTVDTGRGLQVYYVMATSTACRLKGGAPNESGMRFFHDVENMLVNSYVQALASLVSAKVDTCVTDLSRVSRIPGSWNSKASRRCRLVSADGPFWDLVSLKAALPGVLDEKARAHRPAPIKFDRLLAARLKKVSELQAMRAYECTGSRENMCFVYYNTAKQVYGAATAWSMTLRFNSLFSEPLDVSELECMRKCVDAVVVKHGANKGAKGFYPLSARRLVELLGMTQAEMQALSFFSSRKLEQRLASKAATRRKREARDARICSLYANGLTQKEVAERVSCSLRTVSSVISRTKTVRGSSKVSRREKFLEVLQVKREHAKNRPTSSCGPRPRRSLALAADDGVSISTRFEQLLNAYRNIRALPCPPPLVV